MLVIIPIPVLSQLGDLARSAGEYQYNVKESIDVGFQSISAPQQERQSGEYS